MFSGENKNTTEVACADTDRDKEQERVEPKKEKFTFIDSDGLRFLLKENNLRPDLRFCRNLRNLGSKPKALETKPKISSDRQILQELNKTSERVEKGSAVEGVIWKFAMTSDRKITCENQVQNREFQDRKHKFQSFVFFYRQVVGGIEKEQSDNHGQIVNSNISAAQV